jgi:hypothetical protein
MLWPTIGIKANDQTRSKCFGTEERNRRMGLG